MSELRTLITTALLDAGVYIDDARFDRVRLDAAGAAQRHLRPSLLRACGQEPRAVAASVHLSVGAIARTFGHGWQQTAGFAALAEVRERRVAEVAGLGGLLSLGIVLFDHLLDTFPTRRARLANRLAPELLRAEPPRVPAAPSGDLGVDSLAELAAAVMSGARRLDGRPEDITRFHQVIAAMHRGELASLPARRAGETPSAAVWESLKAKSALPATAVATFAKLAAASASEQTRAILDRAADLVGEAFWIIDDLVDVRADWEAGAWSRAVWLLLDWPGETPASGEDAVRRLLQTGIADAEAKRLSQVLGELAALPVTSDRTLLRPVQAAVRSWVEEIPPGP